ncbi:fatty acid--CoA ligase [Halomonas campisalis]|uniref:Fatty acid--CoA ligase n=1 Tax=Billgrantia campisalis TaxID=74661 RepID=A0ABS9P5C3_9GAMM|nr:fatty acid--CoA ligase [Halomonas campisalis]MCG6656987.1 fatty acid--CoA ligase [Halomonas campisalis]MDR5862174.1 fatty acid--CoA ligase [Halomonas campisalis]
MKTRVIEPASSAYQTPLLIKSILQASQRHEVDNEIIYRGDKSYDYRTFHERVCRLANMLEMLGIGPGDTVGVLDWDSHRYLECYFAVPMIGAVLHHVNIRLSDEQILYTINHAEDRFLFVHEDFLPIIERIHPQVSTVEHYVRLADNPGQTESRFPFRGEYESLMAEASPSHDFPDFDENSIATTFYTSGTTGNPKGVYFTHRQLVLHTLNTLSFGAAYASLPMLNSDDIYMPLTPMFHVHAWGVPYAATMLGMKQVYPGRYEPNALLHLIQEEGVTFSHCVPTILQMILSCPAAAKADLSEWKVVIGGSSLSQGLARQALERGIDIYSGYGMSESCPMISLSHLSSAVRDLPLEEQIPYRINTRISNFVEVRLLDSEGKEQPHDGKSAGEIVVRAPWLTQGYLHEPHKSEELWEGGWLHTGDIGCLHPDGTLEIKDRLKDVIKTGGEWISSLELEDLISSHPGVDSVAVIGLADTEWGERPHAVVKPSQEGLLAEEIRQHLQQFVDQGRINKWWIPDTIRFVEEIPKTSVGKLDKKVIRAQIQSEIEGRA